MGAGSSVSLKKATNSQEEAGKLFDDLDANHDGQLTIVEVNPEDCACNESHLHMPIKPQA